MKWVKGTSIALAGFIIIVTGAYILLSQNLDNRVADAHGRGSEEGHARGYTVGYQEGGSAGYRDGNMVGYQEGSTVGYEEGRKEGYNTGYTTGFEEGIGTDYLVFNPTYDEMQEILAESETGSARGINDNADSKGIRAAYVRIRIATWYPPHRIASKSGGEGLVLAQPFTRADWSPYYYWVAFETVDKGLIFIQPWSGKEVELEVGKRYSELNGFYSPDYDDTIVEIIIVW